jgi:type VI secretion system secreted protein VgrG
VLGPFGALDVRLTAPYPSRNYTTQYRESDWAFASRLMQEEGIFYFFRHDDDGHTLVLADGPAACQPVPGLLPLAFEDTPDAEKLTAYPATRTWDITQELCPTETTVWDSHFEMFGRNLAGEAAAATPVTAGDAEFHPAPQGGPAIPVYRHDGDYAKRYDGVAPGGGDRSADLNGVYPDADRTARLRQDQSAASAVRVTAATNAPQLAPGFVATLSGHPDLDDKYVVTRGTLAATVPQAYWAIDAATDFRCTNAVEAVPAGVAPRPPVRTPRPKVGGPLTAVVTGPAGQEIFVDQYGRVKLQFFWDRAGPNDADSSCWVRVAQLWAGKTWGAFFWPRIGMEVVVQFIDGDPDRPLVTGCVYNGVNLPPTTLPAEAMVGGIKSLIFGGDPASNFNAIYIHDAPGVEYVQVHSERSELAQSETAKYHHTGTQIYSVHGQL